MLRQSLLPIDLRPLKQLPPARQDIPSRTEQMQLIAKKYAYLQVGTRSARFACYGKVLTAPLLQEDGQWIWD